MEAAVCVLYSDDGHLFRILCHIGSREVNKQPNPPQFAICFESNLSMLFFSLLLCLFLCVRGAMLMMVRMLFSSSQDRENQFRWCVAVFFCVGFMFFVVGSACE